MDFRVVRKYFYQKWRGHSLKNNTRREIVFLLLGAQRYSLKFGNLLRLTFIRINSVMDDGAILGLFMDSEVAKFVKFSTAAPTGDTLFDLTLMDSLPIVENDMTSLVAYLDLPSVFHEVGVDLASAGPDPMSSPEAFFLKLLWPGYTENDEKYVAITIAGILATRSEQEKNTMPLPPYSMHLTEVGMHLKSLEAVDASLAWALPALKNEGLRLARFLGKSDTERYFSVSDSPCHHSDKVVSLNASLIWRDAERLWSLRDVGSCLRDGEFLTAALKSPTETMEDHMAYITRLSVESALSDEMAKTGVQEASTPNLSPRRASVGSEGVGLRESSWNASKRRPLSNLAHNIPHAALCHPTTPVYFPTVRGSKIQAAAPAGCENDVENIYASHF